MSLIERVEALGLRTIFSATASGVTVLLDPAEHLMPSGAVPLPRATFLELREYSSSLPTGQTPGKVWKARLRSGWWLGRYGDPYPKGHEHHGSIPIDWWPIYIIGQPPAFPRDVTVPRPRGCGWRYEHATR